MQEISRRRLTSAGDDDKEAARLQVKVDAQAPCASLSELPDSWAWASLLKTSWKLVDCHNKTAPYTSTGIALVRTSNIRDGKITLEGAKYVSQSTYEHWSKRCPPRAGDILFTREAPMGEAGIVQEGMKLCMGQRMMLVRVFPDLVDPRYLLMAMCEPAFQERMTKEAVGSTVKHLRVGDVESLMIPLPPFEEQRRIVAKVDQLMALCDTLEAALRRAEATAQKLAQAVVAELVAAPAPAEPSPPSRPAVVPEPLPRFAEPPIPSRKRAPAPPSVAAFASGSRVTRKDRKPRA